MRTPLGSGARIGVLVGAAVLCGSALAEARVTAVTSVTTKVQGTATGPGVIGRTITDVTGPNSPWRRGPSLPGVQGGSFMIPVTTGMTANQIGRALRDSINNNLSLQATGYSATFGPPNDSSLVKLSRSAGEFNLCDTEDVPGVTLTYLVAAAETVWVGHVRDVSGSGPYHVGSGPARPGVDPNGLWDWDSFHASDNDSAMGWWPVRRAAVATGAVLPDYQRAWAGLDFGNQGNYSINQGQPKRTFGVRSYWHADGGSSQPAVAATPNLNPLTPTWAPLAGTRSAWCGLRSHGDIAAVDAIAWGGTGQPLNQSAVPYTGENSPSPSGTSKAYPGYGSQWDQMLYRDILLQEGDGLNISFNFSTDMSTSKNSTAGVQIGWFDKDPISNAQSGVGTGATPTSDGNFISATVAGANAPCDSFMVYIGAPVIENDVTFSAPLFVGVNLITTVHDARRRWFSEVLRCTPSDQHYKELASYAGVHAPTSVSVDVGTLYPAVLQDIKNAQAGPGGTVRLVFRVKTNRGFDDENSDFSSGTRGAAIVDNVVMNGWAAANGNFEAVNAIDNDTAVNPINAWKSTGKPPAIDFHAHSIASLPFAPSDPSACNLAGKVISIGNHDAMEKASGLYGSNDQEWMSGVISPTINLASLGPGDFNAVGLDADIVSATDDIYLRYEVYTGLFDEASTGVGWVVGVQSFPALSSTGVKSWGEIRYSTIYADPVVRCVTDVRGLYAHGLIHTSNASGVPDSIRVYLGKVTRCYAYGLVEFECAPTVGANAGGYFDNVSIGFVDMEPVLAAREMGDPARLEGGCGPLSAGDLGPPLALELAAPSPNPFRSTSVLTYQLPVQGQVRLAIHDLLGRRVRTLLDAVQPGGRSSTSWDGRDDSGRSLPAGLYLVRMRFEDQTQRRIVVKVR